MVCESELELSARLFRALTHRIRGDLSVITNDLAYLSAVVDPSELERPRARCGQIATTLAALSALSKSSGQESIALREVLTLFNLPTEASHALVAVDKGLASEAVALTRALVGGWKSARMLVEQPEKIRVFLVGLGVDQLKQSYGSISAFASSELGEKSVVEGCVADIIFREHGWAIEIGVVDGAATVRCDIPVVLSRASA